MIGLCTDSNAQLPAALSERFGIEVVPLTVVVDDREYLEGFDLDVDDFYGLFAGGHRPGVAFGLPSPGQFAAAYDDLIARGCTEILSIHTSAAVSGILKAARLAAHSAPVPIRLVDSHTARFGVSCCVWAAAEACAAGASIHEAAHVAESVAPRISTVFTTAGLDLLARDTSGATEWPDGARARVSTLVKGRGEAVGEVSTLIDAVNELAAFTARAARDAPDLNVAVGFAHHSLRPVAEVLASAVRASPHIRDVVQFRIGPSVGIETGPGTVGCVYFSSTRRGPTSRASS